jgi:hypothetical protein
MQLIIEYVFEGHRRGYNYTSATRGLDDETLKLIWRTAMPRGQGWGADVYAGAHSLKCFPLDERTVALSDVTVTDLRDEGGRRGIRRAVIDVLSADACYEALKDRLQAYPAAVQERLERKPSIGQWKRIVDQALPKVRKDAQVILTHPYTGFAEWQFVEAMVIKVAVARMGPLKRGGKIMPFTTMALDYHDESRLVALPAQQLKDTDDIAIIKLD